MCSLAYRVDVLLRHIASLSQSSEVQSSRGGVGCSESYFFLMVAVFRKKALPFQPQTQMESRQSRRSFSEGSPVQTNQATCVFLEALPGLSCKHVSATEWLTICPVLFASPSLSSECERSPELYIIPPICMSMGFFRAYLCP